jgi:hypothetical protein
MALTNAEIADLQQVGIKAGHQTPVQAARYTPVVIDLSSGTDTIGRKLLDAINADSDLLAEFGDMDENGILESITAIAFRNPTTSIEILAYAGAATHKATLLASQDHYIPAVQLWRQYASGPAATTVDVLHE